MYRKLPESVNGRIFAYRVKVAVVKRKTSDGLPMMKAKILSLFVPSSFILGLRVIQAVALVFYV